jgi:hypothetical protein
MARVGCRGFVVFLVEDSNLLAEFLTERMSEVGLRVVGRADNAMEAIDAIRVSRRDASQPSQTAGQLRVQMQ